MLLLALLATTTYFASAHSITVDGALADWSTQEPPAANTGLVVRDAAEHGEYVFKDASADERTAFATPDPRADITHVRYTGTATHLHALVKVASLPVTAGVGTVQVQLAVDQDRLPLSGETSFVGGDTSVGPDGRWERLLKTQFGSGASTVAVYSSAVGSATPAGTAANAANGTIELSVPWSAIGLAGPPSTPLRFSVAAFRATAGDEPVDTGAGSDALDVLTDYGDPGVTNNTAVELADGDIDYFADVHFTAGGEVEAPVVVSNFAPNQANPGAEFVQVANATGNTLDLAAFKVGDAADPTVAAEGVSSFPVGTTLAAGARLIIARDGAAYQAQFGSPPDFELVSSSAAPDMQPFALWAAGAQDLDDAGDEVVVLDGSNTTVDAIAYGTGTYGGVVPKTPAPAQTELQQRNPSLRDTDDTQADFSAAGCAGTKTWDGGAATASWHDANNWNPNGVPGPTDHVCIANMALAAITFNSGTTNVLSVTSAETITHTAGTLNLTSTTQPSQIAVYNLAGGTLGGAGTLSLTTTLNWTNGDFRDGGTTRVPSSGTLLLSGNSLKDVIGSRRIENFSATPTTWTGTGSIRLDTNSVFEHHGVLRIDGDQEISHFNCCGLFVNHGTVRKISGAGESTTDARFNNLGQVLVDAGTLAFQRDGTHSGPFTINAGGLRFSTGTQTFNGAITGAAATSVLFNGGTNAVNGPFNVPSLSVASSGTTTFADNATPTTFATLNVSGGRVNFNDNVAPTTFTQSGGTLGGSATVTVGGALHWTGGDMNDGGATIVTDAATLTLGGGIKDMLSSRRFENHSDSTTPWTAGQLRLDTSAVFENHGVINIAGDHNITHFNCCGLFRNFGTLRKTAGTGESTTDARFENNGSVVVDAGTLAFQRDGTHSGPFTINAGALRFSTGTQTFNGAITGAAGTTVHFNGGTQTINGVLNVPNINAFSSGTATVTANGTATTATNLTVSGGRINFNDDITPATVSQSGGTIGGSGRIDVGGSYTWTGGDLNDSGTTRVADGATLSLAGSLKDLISNRVFVNDSDSTAAWTAGALRIDTNARFDNNGVINLAGDHNISHFNCCGLFRNFGTFRKTAGAGESLTDARFNNSGQVIVDSGTLAFNRDSVHTGSFDVNTGGMRISASTHTSSGPVTADPGTTVAFTGGTFTQTGPYEAARTDVSSSGTVVFNGTTTALLGTLNQFNGTVGGSGIVRVADAFNWFDGTQTGVGTTLLPAGAATTWTGASKTLSGTRTIDNSGAIVWRGGDVTVGGGTPDGATILNRGTLESSAHLTMHNSTGGVFRNLSSGTVRKSAVFGGGFFGNAGAEDGAFTTGRTDAPVASLPGWSRSGSPANGTVVRYGSAEFPDAADSAAIGGGNNFFAAGYNTASSRIFQTVDLSSFAGSINAGAMTVRLEGALGGRGPEADTPTLLLEYLDGATVRGSLQLGPVTPADRSNETKLMTLSTTGVVPAGTTSARITLIGDRDPAGDAYNDAYFDNVRFRLYDGHGVVTGPAHIFGTTTINPPFDNDGAVAVEEGSLNFTGGSPALDHDSGTYSSSPGGALVFGGGTRFVGDPASASPAGSVTGAGSVRFLGGTTFVRSPYDVGMTALWNNNGVVHFEKTAGVDATPARTDVLNQSEGYVGGADLLEVDVFNWAGGSHFGSGHTRVFDGGVWSSGQKWLYQGRDMDLEPGSATTWTGGSALNIGSVGVGQGSILTNRGVFEVTSPTALDVHRYNEGGNLGKFFNAPGATFRKTGAGLLTFNGTMPLENDGVLEASRGTFQLFGGSGAGSDGDFVIGDATPAGDVLEFGTNDYLATAASSVTGDGTASFVGATATLGGEYDVASTSITSSGRASFTKSGPGDAASARTDTLTQTGENTYVEGDDELVVRTLSWNGGSHRGSGRTTVAEAATLAGGNKWLYEGRDMVFSTGSTAAWTNGTLNIGSINGGPGSVLENRGVFTIAPTAAQDVHRYNEGANLGKLLNAAGGLVRKTTTAEITFHGGMPYENDGVTELQAGAFRLHGGSGAASDGSFVVGDATPAGDVLEFGTNHYAFGTASSVTGPGTVSFVNSSTDVSGGYDVSATSVSGGAPSFERADAETRTLALSSGTIGGAGVLTLTGPGASSWTGGQMVGAGTTAVASGVTLNLSGSNNKTLRRRIENAGTAVWSGTGELESGEGAVFANSGLFEIQNNQTYHHNWSGTSLIRNTGTIRKTVGTGQTALNATTNNTDGTLEAFTGTLFLNGPFTNFAANTLTGGTYNVRGTLKFHNADVRTNQANVILDGVSSKVIDNVGAGADGFRSFERNGESGVFKILNGRNLHGSGAAGQPARGPLLDNDGRFGGTGTVFANVVNDTGTIAPGASPGLLTVNGNYTQNTAGTLEIEVANTSQAAGVGYDRLAITGTAMLAGRIAGIGLPGFIPVTANGVDVVTMANRGGTTFGTRTTTPDPLPGNLVFQERYPDEQTVRLFEVPTASVPDLTVSVGDVTATTATINVTLSAESLEAITVAYATVDGTALAGVDYTAASGSLSFAPRVGATPGETTKSFQVPITPDLLDEEDETFLVNLTGATNAEIRDGQATVTIVDDDVPPTLSVANVSVDEGDPPGTTTATFTLALNGPSAKTIAVTASTADGTATAPADYVAKSELFTFAPGVTSKTFTVDVVREDLNENNETFAVGLTTTTPLNVQLPAGPATGTIVDEDTLRWSVNDVTIGEGGDAVFTVTLNRLSDAAQTVSFATGGGNAAAGADYVARTDTLSIPAGQLTGTVTVDTNLDLADEVDETFELTLSAPSEGFLLDGTGVGTIDDDDGPTVSISGPATITESGGATYLVSLSAASPQEVSAAVDTSNGSAASLLDYAPVSTTVVFTPGQTAKTVAVSSQPDSVDEIDETFNLTLSAPVDAALGTASALIAIDDDDGPAAAVVDKTVAEGDTGSQNAVVTVQLSAPSPQATTVHWATADGTATSGEDYTSASGDLTIPAGQPSGTVAVPITGDIQDEADETVLLNLSSPVDLGGTSNGAITIDDDDGVSGGGSNAKLSIDNVTLAEGDAGATNAVFTVTLTGTPSTAVSVVYATADGTATSADYAATTGTLIFGLVAGTQTISVPVSGDNRDEANETFTVNLSSPAGASLDDAQGLGTITDDDVAPVVADLPELATDEDQDLTITLGEPTDAEEDPVTYEIVSGPTHGDLGAIDGNEVTYSPDENHAGGDAFTFRSSDGTNFSNVATATITIDPLNDAPVAVEDAGSVSEDGRIEIVVLANDVDVDGDDLNVTSVANPPSGSAEIVDEGSTTIAYQPDANFVGFDEFEYSITDNHGGSATGVITIFVSAVNDPPAAPTRMLTVGEDSTFSSVSGIPTTDVDEDAVTVTAVSEPLHGDAQVASGSVQYRPDPNYHGPDTFTYTVSDGVVPATGQVNVTVTPVNDAPTAGGVAITTNEDVPAGFTLSGTDVDGDTLTFSAPASTSLGTISGGTDAARTFTPTPNVHGTANFSYTVTDGKSPAVEASGSITVNSVNDAPVAQDQNATTPEQTAKVIGLGASDPDTPVVNVTREIVSGPANGTLGTINGTDVTYTPNEDYNGVDTFRFRVNDGEHNSAPATVTITVTPVNDVPVAQGQDVVTVANRPATVTLRATDVDNGSHTFAVGTPPANGGVTIDGDEATYTPDSGFTGDDSFTFTANDGAATSAPAAINVEVVAAGSVPNATMADRAAIAEADDQVVFTLVSPAAAVIRVSTDDDTAKAGADYIDATATLAFAGAGSRQFPVKLKDDATDEPNETFRVTIEVLSGGVTAPDYATGTIIDDDPLVAVAGGAANAGEGNVGSHTVDVPVSLSAPSAKTVQVSFATADGSATALEDYLPTSGTLTFVPGQTTRTVPVTILGDLAIEPDEALALALSSPEQATVAGGGSVTIVNDDSGLPPPPPLPPAPITPTADLAIAMSGPETSGVDRSVTYSVSVRNNGPDAATGVLVRDVLPGGLQLVSASVGQVACPPGATVVCRVGTLASGGTAALTIIATTAEPGVHSNTATVSGDQADPNASNNAATATTRVPVPVNRDAQQRSDGCTQRGTGGADVLRGTAGRDVLCGMGGNDVLIGAGGNDVLLGGAGNDRLLGGAGNDVLKGGIGHDELLGGGGADRLDGGRGPDVLAGERGNDVLNGSYGNDFVIGGRGTDRVLGGPGKDRLRRDAQDTALGGPGRDQCIRTGVVSVCP